MKGYLLSKFQYKAGLMEKLAMQAHHTLPSMECYEDSIGFQNVGARVRGGFQPTKEASLRNPQTNFHLKTGFYMRP